MASLLLQRISSYTARWADTQESIATITSSPPSPPLCPTCPDGATSGGALACESDVFLFYFLFLFF
jgi:hypothetical protein